MYPCNDHGGEGIHLRLNIAFISLHLFHYLLNHMGYTWPQTKAHMGSLVLCFTTGSAATDDVPPPPEDVKGPHASLAVRLVQRDPGRVFVLGERLRYVLLSGMAKQEDAAEDPLTTATQGLPVNHELIWTNKIRRPLSEIMGTVLSPAQLQVRLCGQTHHVAAIYLAGIVSSIVCVFPVEYVCCLFPAGCVREV